MKRNLQSTLQAVLRCRALTVFALTAMVVSSLAATNWAQSLYILTGVTDTAIVLDGSQAIPDLSDRMIHVSSDSRGYDIFLREGMQVTICRDGVTTIIPSKAETVSALLHRLDMKLSPLEMVAVDLSGSHAKLTVGEEVTYYYEVQEPAAFETVRVANPKLLEGTENVVQEGADGVRTSIYEVVWSNGEELSRQFVEVLDSTAVNRIVEYGTAVPAPASTNSTFVMGCQDPIASVEKREDGSGVLVLESGTTLNFSQVKSMTATAYTAGHGGADYTTATGTFVNVGTVAVDKKVIPLGTKLYIVTSDGIVYGTAVACDTGVRGNKVDLYFPSYRECIEFGRRSCSVYILDM